MIRDVTQNNQGNERGLRVCTDYCMQTSHQLIYLFVLSCAYSLTCHLFLSFHVFLIIMCMYVQSKCPFNFNAFVCGFISLISVARSAKNSYVEGILLYGSEE